MRVRLGETPAGVGLLPCFVIVVKDIYHTQAPAADLDEGARDRIREVIVPAWRVVDAVSPTAGGSPFETDQLRNNAGTVEQLYLAVEGE